MKTGRIVHALAILSSSVFAVVVLAALTIPGPADGSSGKGQQVSGGSSSKGADSPDRQVPTALKPVKAVAMVPAPQPVTVAMAGAGDVARGAKVFAKCKACHTDDEGGKDKVGPNLWSVVDRPVASRPGFKYSRAMQAKSGETWRREQLDAYLADPKTFIPKNKMAFAGLKKADDRRDVIAYLASRSANADMPDAIRGQSGMEGAGRSDASPSSESPDATVSAGAALPAAGEEAVSPERKAEIEARVAALRDQVRTLDYERARYHPLHFSPQIEKASNEECLVCHQEILDHKPREKSGAGVDAIDVLAWYQTLDTYQGQQQTFHWRHIESPYAKQVMKLDCNFCHKGNDPREESPDMVPNKPAFSADPVHPAFTNRKMVNPSETCLLCHGAMPDPVDIMGIGAPWPEARADLEDEETPNGCLTCHEELFRTVRHQVTYLKPQAIEEAAKKGSDVCYGCHGGRQWYRISYPYPRHPWPGMDPETPEWAKDRPTESRKEYRLQPSAAK
ncbi:hypothetical protein CSC94_15400 [Zhengella mangrovi]|uniref:Cytochrome c domain-containing protein n=1 Tax=Zhengella mangrovi TaxID=1982044 RepID=A0A2G1QM58_9HYPH|nr:cytochrome c family protein [Zhengella mangrovi]PHP66308.1 hypothetical protein CSC94_15400 [Zhengella mangrovi]